MGKIKSLAKLLESTETIKIIFDKNSFSMVGDAGVSSDYSEDEILDLLDKLNVPSYEQLIQKAKTLKTHQSEFELDSKDVKKLNLK